MACFSGERASLPNGGIQGRLGAMEEEAVGCDEVPAEGEVLGVPPAPFHFACHPSHSPRQGSPFGLQGQAGLCGLPCTCKTCWTEETSSQGHCVWKTNKPRCNATEIPTQQALHCRGALWSLNG